MTDLTYTASGTFDKNSGNLTLELMIPQEDPDNGYETIPMYDLSKTAVGGNINCVLCFLKLKNDGGQRLFADKYDFSLAIANSALTSYTAVGRVSFNPNLNDALFLLFHVDDLDLTDIAQIYENVEDYYIQSKNGNFNIEIETATLGRPKVLGVSVIDRR